MLYPRSKDTCSVSSSLNIDSSLISLKKWGTNYFCYPTNAKTIVFENCIMYCFIDGYGETIFACNPESCADIYIFSKDKKITINF